MANMYNAFLKKLLIFSGIVALIEFILNLSISTDWASPYWWLSLVFFIAIDIISYRVIWKQLHKGSRRLINAFLTSATIRVLLSLLVIISYALTHPTDAKAFTAIFFINYLLFTIFETKETLSLSKKSK